MPLTDVKKVEVAHKQAYLENGLALSVITLKNGFLSVTLTNLGATIMAIELPDRNGLIDNVVVAYEDINDYITNRFYLGCTVGRYANRIGNARFQIDGQTFQLSRNENGHHLHGGVNAFHKKTWKVESIIEEQDRAGVVMSYFSKDGEEGYPGNLQVSVVYELDKKNCLAVSYRATTDKKGPVNLTNHSYFNLAGASGNSVTDHLLQINAKSYTEKNDQGISTGKILPLSGMILNFASLRRLGDNIEFFKADRGYNHNYVLADTQKDMLNYAATLIDPCSGRYLKMLTDQPGLQLYTANFWDNSPGKKGGGNFCRHGAVALEPQALPDSVNHSHFPNTLLEPNDVYLATTVYEFGITTEQS